MYFGEGKILDAIDLEKPNPMEFAPVYRSGRFHVVLRIWDPFAEQRVEALRKAATDLWQRILDLLPDLPDFPDLESLTR
jgi:hypothetical protein